jgi:hypothetical protein
VVEDGQCSNPTDVNSKEYDQLSPLSVLEEETFITNESCCTSEDSTCSDSMHNYLHILHYIILHLQLILPF